MTKADLERRARRAHIRKWVWWVQAPAWLALFAAAIAGLVEWTIVERISLGYIGAVSIVTQATAEQATEESARDAV